MRYYCIEPSAQTSINFRSLDSIQELLYIVADYPLSKRLDANSKPTVKQHSQVRGSVPGKRTSQSNGRPVDTTSPMKYRGILLGIFEYEGK